MAAFSSSSQLTQKPASIQIVSKSKKDKEKKPRLILKDGEKYDCFTLDFIMQEPSLIFNILIQLSRYDICSLSRVSKSWNRLLKHGPFVEDMWETIALRDWTRPFDVQDLKARKTLHRTWKNAVRSRVERDQQRLLRILTSANFQS